MARCNIEAHIGQNKARGHKQPPPPHQRTTNSTNWTRRDHGGQTYVGRFAQGRGASAGRGGLTANAEVTVSYGALNQPTVFFTRCGSVCPVKQSAQYIVVENRRNDMVNRENPRLSVKSHVCLSMEECSSLCKKKDSKIPVSSSCLFKIYNTFRTTTGRPGGLVGIHATV